MEQYFRKSYEYFELNGKQVTVSGDHPHLLAALRDELGILSAKDGCSPTGQCGCCTVIMDGKARISCQLTPERANGSKIQTLEGLDSKEIDEMGQAFAACGALQCGFCTPGIMIRTKVLVDKKGPNLRENMLLAISALIFAGAPDTSKSSMRLNY